MDDSAQQVLKVDLGGTRCKRLPAWFFAGPRVVELWPPESRPVWGRAKSPVILAAAPSGSPSDMLIDPQAWTRAMQQNTRLWVRQFGTTLGQVNYFQQLQARMSQRMPSDVRSALEALAGSTDGALLFSVLPELALRSLGHSPLPANNHATEALLGSGSAVLVWPALLVAPSCCDASLAEVVQRALSPEALRRLSDFCTSPLGTAFLGLLRELARDPGVMTADMTVRNNLQAGLRDELQAMQRESIVARMRDMGEQLGHDVVQLRTMLAEKQDVFLRAMPELDRALIALQEVEALATELRTGPAPHAPRGAREAVDTAWEITLVERVQHCVPRMHHCVADLLSAVGLREAAAPTLALLFRPMTP